MFVKWFSVNCLLFLGWIKLKVYIKISVNDNWWIICFVGYFKVKF